ncbi:hypothetical protein MMC20_005106 [Loxospora ochrophaea]|nr:hypothetical protein [Loxospora ochrophaea]
MSSSTSPQPVALDGTTLEGGGQLLRVALALSSLTRTPIHVTNIRGKRGSKSDPDKAGGLKPAHLACVEWLAKATGADTVGMEPRSRDLVFQPSLKGDAVIPTSSRSGNENSKAKTKRINATQGSIVDEGVWKGICENGLIMRRQTQISLSSPGSVFLVLQAILPYILFFTPTSPAAPLSSDEAHEAIPVRITMEGGTNVTHSPSAEYADQVLFPMLQAKLGIPQIKMGLRKRGWTTGKIEMGSVSFDIIPLNPGSTLRAFSMTSRGRLTKLHVSIIAPGFAMREAIRSEVTKRSQTQYPNVEILFPIDEDSNHSKRLYLLLVAETSGMYRLGRDWLFDGKSKDPSERVQNLVSKVMADLSEELAHGGCVDEYMQDQLVIFQTLAKSTSLVARGEMQELSLHTLTARWVAEKMLGAEFSKDSCQGIGFMTG